MGDSRKMSVLGRYYNELLRFAPLIEGLILFVAVYVGAILRLGDVGLTPGGGEQAVIWPEALTFTVVLLVAMTTMGLYNKRLRERMEGIIIRLVLAFVVGTVLLALLFYALDHMLIGRGVLGLSLLTAFFGIVIVRSVMAKALSEPENLRRIVVLGTGRNAASLTQLRRRTDLIGLRIIGYIRVNGETSDIPEDRKIELEGRLSDWVAARGIDEIVVAPDERRKTLDMDELMTCRARGVLVSDLNTFVERETGCLQINQMTPGWFAFSNGLNTALVGDRVKRLLDIGASLAVLLPASPLILAAAIAIRLESGRGQPILYRQTRVGRNGEPFQLFKFRSMCCDAEKPGEARWAERKDPRVTRVGAILRRFRIDELPQLFNVLRGDMSFVGPRPERPEFVSSLEQNWAHYADRHRVKPGLTGWAQIRYPYGATEQDAFEKLRYDLYYVKNRSLYLDLVIMLQTAEVVLWGHGVR